MIKPVLKGEALLKNIHASASAGDHLRIWWLGQSGFLIQYQGTHLLCDPFLTNSPIAGTSESEASLVRMTEVAIEPRALDFIDLVTASDLQRDHFDPETVKPLLDVNSGMDIVVPEAVRGEAAEQLGCDADLVTGLDDGLNETLEGVTVVGVAATGEEGRDPEGRCRRLGYVLQLGPWMIYHSGDVVTFEGLEEQLQAFAIDVALLPIGGRHPETGLPPTLSAAEAAELAKTIDARMVIPCHFEMFDTDASAAEELGRACARLDQPFRVLRCGEQWSDRELEDLASAEDEPERFDRLASRGRPRLGKSEADDY